MENIGHHARSRAKDYRTFLPGPLIKKEYHVVRMRARLILIPMRSTECAV